MENENNFLKLYEEITTIRQLVEILAKDGVIKEIEKIASTKERKMVWNLLDSKLSTSEIVSGLEKIGYGESYSAVKRHLKKLSDREQLNRERKGREFQYWNPLMYKEVTN